tara:strand:- start:444 stop:671 length:228 start_codon:yes stop_codon:yes gene_type:complete
MYLFRYLGAFYFWIFLKSASSFNKKEPPTFKDIFHGNGRYNPTNISDVGAYSIKLNLIGAIVTGVILTLLVKSGI